MTADCWLSCPCQWWAGEYFGQCSVAVEMTSLNFIHPGMVLARQSESNFLYLSQKICYYYTWHASRWVDNLKKIITTKLWGYIGCCLSVLLSVRLTCRVHAVARCLFHGLFSCVAQIQPMRGQCIVYHFKVKGQDQTGDSNFSSQGGIS